jgi:hypothetical protein
VETAVNVAILVLPVFLEVQFIKVIRVILVQLVPEVNMAIKERMG